jgi:hypothetical protein
VADKPSDKLERLRALADTPPEQATYAVRFLKDRTPDVVLAAARVLGEREDPAFRAPMLAAYTTLAANPTKRDPGGTLRIALLDALRPIAQHDDVPLFERAASSFEFLYGEVAGDLRAAGLRALQAIDPTLAGYYAVRSLDDPHMTLTQGEPALTAIKVLAAQDQSLPIYAYALREGAQHADVVAEALRSLTRIPRSTLATLVERYQHSTSEIVLLGFFDLLLGHRDGAAHDDVVFHFLRTTTHHNLYRYVLILLVNRHDPDLDDVLLDLARRERDHHKRAIWDDVWALRRR